LTFNFDNNVFTKETKRILFFIINKSIYCKL
jgi:hypothetical protein